MFLYYYSNKDKHKDKDRINMSFLPWMSLGTIWSRAKAIKKELIAIIMRAFAVAVAKESQGWTNLSTSVGRRNNQKEEALGDEAN